MALEALLTRVDQLKLEIEKLRPLTPQLEKRIMDKFRLDWNYHSNAIEGNQLTLGETHAFLLEGLTARGKPLKDHLDIKGHNEVVSFLAEFIKRKATLDEATIRELHKILLHEPYTVQARTPEGGTTTKTVKLGEYKTEPNFVYTSTGEVRSFVLPQDTPDKMHGLLDWLRQEQASQCTHAIVTAAVFHHTFVRIHPFDDGNGRLARILMNLILMQKGFPPVIIRMQQRDQYISALIKADAGEQNDLISLIAEAEIASEELFLKGAHGENIEDYDDVDKKIALLKQELKHNEEPAELTPAVQKQFLTHSVKPLFLRLLKKLSQFDELFQTTRIFIAGNYSVIGAPGGPAGYRADADPNDREAMFTRLEADASRFLFKTLQLNFFWESFRRGGLDTFSEGIIANFTFSKFSFEMTLTHRGSGRELLHTKNVYQIGLSDDETRTAATASATTMLEHIQKQASNKK